MTQSVVKQGRYGEAITLSNRFLREGEIVSLKNRSGEVLDRHEADPDLCTLPNLPVAILVDRNSASASEVFSAALQDHDRATVVGERTFGKGVVQQIYTWPNRDFRLKMTSSHYYTPSGRNLSRLMRRDADGDDPGGVDPNKPIAMTGDDVKAMNEKLRAYETPAEHRAAVDALAAELGFEVPDLPGPDEDPCLAAALEALTKTDGR